MGEGAARGLGEVCWGLIGHSRIASGLPSSPRRSPLKPARTACSPALPRSPAKHGAPVRSPDAIRGLQHRQVHTQHQAGSTPPLSHLWERGRGRGTSPAQNQPGLNPKKRVRPEQITPGLHPGYPALHARAASLKPARTAAAAPPPPCSPALPRSLARHGSSGRNPG